VDTSALEEDLKAKIPGISIAKFSSESTLKKKQDPAIRQHKEIKKEIRRQSHLITNMTTVIERHRMIFHPRSQLRFVKKQVSLDKKSVLSSPTKSFNGGRFASPIKKGS